MTDQPFVEFPKIFRLRRDIVITEKIDGTNAQVHVSDDGVVRAGSRTRWITPEDDNYGFAAWVRDHADELRALGPGSHFGEWWGQGIQRRYGLTEKRFSLFNVARWGDVTEANPLSFEPTRPACCHVVPTLYMGPNVESEIDVALSNLRLLGSVAAPGFMKPEGIVIFHTASRSLSKVTVEKDEEPKGKAEWLAKQAAKAAASR